MKKPKRRHKLGQRRFRRSKFAAYKQQYKQVVYPRQPLSKRNKLLRPIHRS